MKGVGEGREVLWVRRVYGLLGVQMIDSRKDRRFLSRSMFLSWNVLCRVGLGCVHECSEKSGIRFSCSSVDGGLFVIIIYCRLVTVRTVQVLVQLLSCIERQAEGGCGPGEGEGEGGGGLCLDDDPGSFYYYLLEPHPVEGMGACARDSVQIW